MFAPPLPHPFTVAGAVLAILWIASLARFFAVMRRVPVLDSGSPGSTAAPGAPRVSVIVAAKDEEADIEACVRSILAQDYRSFDLVVVDDRSADETPAILERLAAEFEGRLKVLTIDELPDGWGGQNHALQQGVRATTAEWICFTDADCTFDSERTLSVAVADAQAAGSDVLSILPRMDAPTPWEQIYLPSCCLVFMMQLRIDAVNDPASEAAYANGAFLLMRRSAYEAIGGHERVRGAMNDDIALARLAKRTGFRLRVAGNSDLYRTRMYDSLASAWTGWTRNFHGSLRTSGSLLAAFATTVTMLVLPWCGFVAAAVAAWGGDGRWPGAMIAWGAAVLVSHAGMGLVHAAFGSSVGASVLYFPGAVFVAGITGRAALRALRGSETVWQGARYRAGD